MKAAQRIEMISGILDSIKDSVVHYEAVEVQYGNRPIAGYGDLNREDSAGSIIRRCVLAREELLRLAKDFGYKT